VPRPPCLRVRSPAAAGGHGVGHNDLSLTHDYLVIARTDPGGDTSGGVSFYRYDYGEADVGLGALEDGRSWGNHGRSQDIGGPTSCSYDDSQCRTEYPETVFFWTKDNG